VPPARERSPGCGGLPFTGALSLSQVAGPLTSMRADRRSARAAKRVRGSSISTVRCAVGFGVAVTNVTPIGAWKARRARNKCGLLAACLETMLTPTDC
jgi:hypothetical protein